MPGNIKSVKFYLYNGPYVLYIRVFAAMIIIINPATNDVEPTFFQNNGVWTKTCRNENKRGHLCLIMFISKR